jgi:pimeloyl-ACP methyl ester carboxylesterase
MVKELTESLSGEFECEDIPYLKEGFLPFEVVELLKNFLSGSENRDFFLVGSSMGAYSWLDFLVHNGDILDNEHLKGVILITPPITLFDDLEKWSPQLVNGKIILRYGDIFRYDFGTFLKLLRWDIVNAPKRVLTLLHPKVVPIIATLDEVVDNSIILKMEELGLLKRIYKIEDGHRLHDKLEELAGILKTLFSESGI